MTTKISRAVVAAAAAAAMMATPSLVAPAHAAPMPAADRVVAKPGNHGGVVTNIQTFLQRLGFYKGLAVDGSYGPKTAAAVRAFQQANRRPVTGIVTAPDYRLLESKAKAKTPRPAYKVIAKRGTKGPVVKTIQSFLKRTGYYGGQFTGYFGDQTYLAVRNFQARNGLPITGVVDANTYRKLEAKAKAAPKPKVAPKPVPSASNRVLARRGSQSGVVKNVQVFLAGTGYFSGNATGYFGDQTYLAVRNFQARNGLPITGVVDSNTYRKLEAKAKAAAKARPRVRLDSRCLTGRAICIDKGDRKMYWVVNGSVKATYQVRTGRPGLATRSGSFQVYLKHPNWYSTLYHVHMPYTMFFSGGQAVHYSSEFARIGYSGAGSHGCVNMNSRSDARWLYSQVRVGDKVIVTA